MPVGPERTYTLAFVKGTGSGSGALLTLSALPQADRPNTNIRVNRMLMIFFILDHLYNIFSPFDFALLLQSVETAVERGSAKT